jgi:hypothetical protein
MFYFQPTHDEAQADSGQRSEADGERLKEKPAVGGGGKKLE